MVARGRRLMMLATGVLVMCLLARGIAPAAVRAAVSRPGPPQVPVLDWCSRDDGFQPSTDSGTPSSSTPAPAPPPTRSAT
jgi:hypothetical protein